jgi:uncharacterized protein YdeI (YjbR/CyaY-like superfamily)
LIEIALQSINTSKGAAMPTSQIDDFIDKLDKWQTEAKRLRETLLSTELVETQKWNQPCYMFENKNIVIIGVFKEYITLSFFKGFLMDDPLGILEAHGENSQSSKSIKFHTLEEIESMDKDILTYINNAIEVEKKGLKVTYKGVDADEVPTELEELFVEMPELKSAFEALTPGRQKAYLIHFSQPKQSKTKVARIEKCMDRIMEGKGLNDCICGLSKRMPSCHGSHKQQNRQ